jgi:DnaK suppressor protein
MARSDLDSFRTALECRQAELGNRTSNRDALAIGSSPDELDRIQNDRERDRAMSNLERQSNQLRDVRAALRRIGAGTFGICVDCDEKINLKRLAAVPWASSCFTCQEAAEHAQRMSGSEIDTSLVIAA